MCPYVADRVIAAYMYSSANETFMNDFAMQRPFYRQNVINGLANIVRGRSSSYIFSF